MWGRDLKRPHALCWLIFFFWARASSWPYSPRATRDESGKPLTACQKRPWECYRDALWICSRLVRETKSMIPNTAHNNPQNTLHLSPETHFPPVLFCHTHPPAWRMGTSIPEPIQISRVSNCTFGVQYVSMALLHRFAEIDFIHTKNVAGYICQVIYMLPRCRLPAVTAGNDLETLLLPGSKRTFSQPLKRNHV